MDDNGGELLKHHSNIRRKNLTNSGSSVSPPSTRKRLRDTASRMFPELWQSNIKSEEDRTAMEEALKEAWATIPVSIFEDLVESTERRVQARIDANGWYTKY
jgi:hypothetical protein